jgi:hypothetical protein
VCVCVCVWLQDTVAHAAAAAHALLYRSLRLKGAAMEAVLGWLAAVAHANMVKASATQLNPNPGGASTAFMLGFSATCLRFCHPFLVRGSGAQRGAADQITHRCRSCRTSGVVRRMCGSFVNLQVHDHSSSAQYMYIVAETRAAGPRQRRLSQSGPNTPISLLGGALSLPVPSLASSLSCLAFDTVAIALYQPG